MTKFKLIIYTIVLPSLLWLSACKGFDGEQTIPAYITVDNITVVNDATNSCSDFDGFFTNNIDCAQLIAYFDGDTAESTLGVFELPCRVPILRQGRMDYLRVLPVVKQNGIAGTHIYYPYYNTITLDSVTVAADSTTALGSLTTTYKNIAHVAWQEFFEPGTQGMQLDSIVMRISDMDTVRSDYGSGVVRVTKDMRQLNFWSHDTIDISQYSKDSYLYLELDYWTDVNFSIGFNNPTSLGGANIIKSAIVLKPNTGWNKIYVNLGRLWSYYNGYPYLRLYFTILNEDNAEGNIYLDNMKMLII